MVDSAGHGMEFYPLLSEAHLICDDFVTSFVNLGLGQYWLKPTINYEFGVTLNFGVNTKFIMELDKTYVFSIATIQLLISPGLT